MPHVHGGLVGLLRGGDRRSIGRVPQVVRTVLREPARFREIFQGMRSPDPVVAMRSADAVEKITARRPELLAPYTRALLRTAAASDQQEVQWHAAQLIPRVPLGRAGRSTAVAILNGYLASESSIVKTFAMQALADLAEQDRAFRPRIVARLRTLTRTGTPAMKSRGRRLLARLETLDAAR